MYLCRRASNVRREYKGGKTANILEEQGIQAWQNGSGVTGVIKEAFLGDCVLPKHLDLPFKDATKKKQDSSTKKR
jgi:hypothetical protein